MNPEDHSRLEDFRQFRKEVRRNSAFGPREEDKDSSEGQVLQGYQVGKGEEPGGKDFRCSFFERGRRF